jgi:acetyl-CoA C-acetyltransferase
VREAVIVSAVRTPIGGFNGALAGVPAPRLGAIAIAEALRRADVEPRDVDEVLMGNALSAGLGQNPARQAAIGAGLPDGVPAVTVNKVCGSGLKAVSLAAQAVILGDAEVVVAGGMENMSAAPYLLERARTGYRMGDGTLVDSMIRDGLWCAFEGCHMGVTAENVASEHEIGRADQDAFAAESQRRAAAAIAGGAFADEIVGVPVPQRRGDALTVLQDEFPRPDTTAEGLARLRAAFAEGGTVTAGNASGINDGAAATVVMSRARARALGCRPMAAIRGYAAVGVAPRLMGMGPVGAIRRAAERAGVEVDDLDLVELNEAFAAQSLAVIRELGLDPERTNVHGGAIALGHPIGASGARVLTTLLHEMGRREARLGLASLCIGGGQGIAMVVEREGRG